MPEEYIDRSDMRRRQQQKRRRKKKQRAIIILIIIAVIIAIIGFFAYRHFFAESKNRMEASDYYKIEGDTGAVFIVSNGEITEDVTTVVENDVAYLPFSYAVANINSRFYYNTESKEIFYTSGTGTSKISPGASTYTDENGTQQQMDYPAVIERNGELYISCTMLNAATDAEIEYFKNPGRVVINEGNKVVEVKSDTYVRYYAGPKSDIITDASKGSKVLYLEDTDDSWVNVLTEDGFKGYIKKSALGEVVNETYMPAEVDTDYTHLSMDDPVCLSWALVSNREANSNIEKLIEGASGLNVVSPTWYSYADSAGTINDYSSAETVQLLHNKGYQVWPVVNDFTNEVDMSVLLSSKKNRDRMIDRLVSDAKYMGYDGLNVDFEKITEDTSLDYLQFIRELSVECRKNNIYLSIDTYPPRSYNSHLNIKEQASYADYIVMMDYDEYYSGSEEAGPVSSLTFVKNNLAMITQDVPAERLINALPFYSRIWITDTSGNMTTEALGMTQVQTTLTANNPEVKWDDSTGMNYTEYTKDNSKYQMWIEDSKSLTEKFKATRDAGVRNVAFWRMGLDSTEIWTTIQEQMSMMQ